MALVKGYRPFGSKGMNFGSPGGTFDNMRPNGEHFYYLVVAGDVRSNTVAIS